LSFVIALIVFAFVLFVLILMLRMINLGPKIDDEGNVPAYLNRAIAPLLFLYLLVVAYSAITLTRPTVWFLFTGLLVGALVLASIMKKSSRLVTLGALLMPIVLIFLTLVINGPTPITQDEGLWTGLSYRIIADGVWKSNVYSLASYYQFFPIIPYLKATISMITGLDMLYFVNPLVMLVVTLLVSLNIYIILKNLIGMRGKKLGVLGPLLFCSAPYLLSIGFDPQTLATVLFLTSLAVLSTRTPEKFTYKNCLITVILISIVGVITHATYPIFLLLTLIALLFAYGKLAERVSEANLLRSVIRVVTLFTLSYWAYTFILDSLVIGYGKPWIQSLIGLITGEAKPFAAGRHVWFDLGPTELAYSFALLPAFAIAYISTEMIPGLRSFAKAKKVIHNLRRNPFYTLGAAGLLLVGLAFITRASPGVGFTRYLGPAYILLVVTSTAIISKIASKKRLVNTTLMVIIIAMSSFYAVLNPSLSPDVHEIMGLANNRSWNVAQTLVRYIPPNLTYRMDQRVDIGFKALAMKSTPGPFYLNFTEKSGKGSLLVLNLDEYGKVWANYYLGEKVLQAIENDTYSIVYTDGLYKMYIVSWQP